MGGKSMVRRIRLVMLAATAAGSLLAGVASTAHAGILSLAPGSCGYPESQVFLPWGDSSYYVPVPGGTFEPGTYSLSLPAGSRATSPPACTGIDHPSMRFFVRNTGASTSRLKVYATYPLLLGLPYTAYLGEVSGSGSWQPSAKVTLGLLNNTLGSLTLGESTVSFTFMPADSTGNWTIDDVYLDPAMRW